MKNFISETEDKAHSVHLKKKKKYLNNLDSL